MNIKQFVEQSERDFDQSFGNNSHASQQEIYDATKLFSLKLRELIGVWRKEVEGMKEYHMEDSNEGQMAHNAALDSVLHLLDEAGGGK